MLDLKDQKCSAHDWWAFEGACGKLIAPIARRILGQTVSSSSYKQNWSSYSFVHNKSRNRLQPKRAEDLVYVYTNSRLMAKGKEKDEKKSSKIMVIWIQMAWMIAILGSEVHMGERTVAPILQGGTMH